MNVFVLGTGRCGSITFIRACRHIENYTCSHESKWGCIGRDRLSYPENHIEADNRLSWFLGSLDKYYGNTAFYVHLTRPPDQVAGSFAKRYKTGIIHAYRTVILGKTPADSDPQSVCRDYCDTVNANIELFLKDKTGKMTFQLGNAQQDFARFWEAIEAEGDFEAALSEFDKRYNASVNSEFCTGIKGTIAANIKRILNP